MIDNAQQQVVLEERFDGGVEMTRPGPRELADAENIILRDGWPTTRPGMRKLYQGAGIMKLGFYFNEDNAKINDGSHTGFWFDFDFVGNALGGGVQGAGRIKLAGWQESLVIVASGGVVWIREAGFAREVGTNGVLGASEAVYFEQANNLVFLFRSGNLAPMVWDGSAAGAFELVPDAAVGDDIPHAERAVFFVGRMWMADGDVVYASAMLNFEEYDLVAQSWGIEVGAGEPGVTLYPFHENMMLCFKRDYIGVLTGIGEAIDATAGDTMAKHVGLSTIARGPGQGLAGGPDAIISAGEDVRYLGYNGIYSIARNEQNKTMLDPTPISEPVKGWLKRVNWAAAGTVCAATHLNYDLWALPIDGSATPNVVLVYDRLGNSGAGCWLGAWRGPMMRPVKFFDFNERLVCLCSDGELRVMFQNDPFDSDSYVTEAPLFDATKTYREGDIVRADYGVVGSEGVFQALVANRGAQSMPNSNWELLFNPGVGGEVCPIDVRIRTRFYNPSEAETPAERYGRCQLIIDGEDALLDVDMISDGGTVRVICAGLEWDRRNYTTADALPWDVSNPNLDFNAPYRQDYAPFVSGDMAVGTDGLVIGEMARHVRVFMPAGYCERKLALEIRNKRGKIRMVSFAMLATLRRMTAMK